MCVQWLTSPRVSTPAHSPPTPPAHSCLYSAAPGDASAHLCTLPPPPCAQRARPVPTPRTWTRAACASNHRLRMAGAHLLQALVHTTPPCTAPHCVRAVVDPSPFLPQHIPLQPQHLCCLKCPKCSGAPLCTSPQPSVARGRACPHPRVDQGLPVGMSEGGWDPLLTPRTLPQPALHPTQHRVPVPCCDLVH